MSNFYVKINKNGNELEFSTDNEKIFDEKIQDILQTFLNNFSNSQENNSEEDNNENNNINNELCDFVDIEPPKESLNQIQDNNQNNNMAIEFEQILDKAQETPTLNFVEPENNNAEFQTFIISQNPQNQMDYLVFAAQYFTKYLNQTNFTLKQLNSKLVPLQNVAIENKTLNEAVEKGYINLVPDCTQTAINKEYCLTQAGEYEYRHQ